MGKEKLLVIELDEATSVPTVFYKGEEVTGKQEVSFNWQTSDENRLVKASDFLIQHVEIVDDVPVVKVKQQGSVSDKLDEVLCEIEKVNEEIDYVHKRLNEDDCSECVCRC